MAPTTFIKLDRSILYWSWYTDADTFRLFVHLLLNANVSDNLFNDVTIKRGSIATSYASLSDKLGISIHRVRNAMDRLKKTGEITVRRYSNFQVITVVNYDKYQSHHYQPPSVVKVARRQTSGSPWADFGQTSGSPRATIKEINNSISKELNNSISVCEIKKEASFSDTDNTKKEAFQKKDNAPARKWGNFNNVSLTDEEYASLKKESENYEYYIDKLSSHMKSTGRRYNCHYATLCSWIMDDVRKGYKIPVQLVNGEVKSKASYDIELAMKKAKTQVPEFKKRERR